MKFKKKKKFKFYFFKYLKIHKKFKQFKNYTAHPHHLVHVPAKFRENTAMRFWVTVRKLNVTDGQTDGQTDRQTDRRRRGALQYLPGQGAGGEIINNI